MNKLSNMNDCIEPSVLPEDKVSIKNSIATKLLKTVFGLYLLIAISITIGHMVIEYNYQKKNIIHDLVKIQKTFEQSLAIEMWQWNQEALSSTIKGLLELPAIAGVKINNMDGNIIASGGIIINDNIIVNANQQVNLSGLINKGASDNEKEVSKFDVFMHKFPIKYSYDEQLMSLGEVTIYSSSSEIFRTVKSSFIMLIVNAFLKTLALWFIFLWVSNFLLRKPLARLATAADNIRLENLETFHVKIKTSGNDELKLLEKSFNSMIENLHNSITEQRQTEVALHEKEVHLRTLIETIPDLVWMKDTEGIFLSCNRKVERLYGAKEADIVGKTDYDFVEKKLADFFREKDIAALSALKPIVNEEEVIFADDGHKEILETIKTPTFDSDGNLIGVLGIARDITKRKKMEAELVQAHKMEAIGTMAGGIAHDFNNILAAILGYAELTKDDIPKDSNARHSIEQVLKAGNRAKDLVRHILTFSHMSGLPQGHTPINPSSIVKEVLKFQRSIIPATIEITSNIDEDCGQINGDQSQIHQVIMNFCTNASHAMEEKGGTLDVSLQKTELFTKDLRTEPNLHPGIYIQLSVRDTGTGLTPKLINKIFDPYFTTKEVGKGSGMGLSVVQGIVSNHGGFVKVESKLKKGSTFKVFFPRIDDKIIEKDNKAIAVLPTGTERILFVDDETMLADIGKSILEKLGYTVTAQTDSSEALNLFKRDPSQFDLVITDQTMPNIPGSELAKQLIQLRSDIPIIMCTGYSSMIDEIKAQDIGIKEYTMKPVKKAVIARLIRDVLDNA